MPTFVKATVPVPVVLFLIRPAKAAVTSLLPTVKVRRAALPLLTT